MRRALTMIELLVALALLTSLCAVMVSWLQTASATTVRLAEPARWRTAAETLLQGIHDDLATGDLGGTTSGPRVTVLDGVLHVGTRARAGSELSGPVVHAYEFDPATGGLRVEATGARPGGRSRTRVTRPLLERVQAWTCTLHEEEPILTVAVTSEDGTTIRRSYRF